LELNGIHQLLKHDYDFSLLDESVCTGKIFDDSLGYPFFTVDCCLPYSFSCNNVRVKVTSLLAEYAIHVSELIVST
jgi:hypothetical protein